jgi:hypothetical protein
LIHINSGQVSGTILFQMGRFALVRVTVHFHTILALLWQIYSRCFSLQISFLQRGHRCGGGRAMSSRMAWRTAGNVGRGGGPLNSFFPALLF